MRLFSSLFRRWFEWEPVQGFLVRVPGLGTPTRKDLETALVRCQSQLCHVLSGSADGIFLFDASLTIAVLNEAAERLTGRPALAVAGGNFLTLFTEMDRETISRLISSLEVGSARLARRSLRATLNARAGEEPMPVEVSITRSGDLGHRYYVASVRDISERERSEHTTALLAALVQSSRDAIISFSRDQRILSWNDGAERLFGFSAEEAIGQPADLLVPPGAEDGPAWYFARVLRGGSFSTETVRRAKDGRLLDVFVSIAPIRNSKSETVGISAIMHDVTERKRDEARLRQAEIVFNSSRDGLAITDASGRVVAVNPAFERITGLFEGEVAGDGAGLIEGTTHGSGLFEKVWPLVDGKDGWQGEITCERKDGGAMPALLTISSVRDDKDYAQNYVATLTDLSQMRDSERKLEHVAHHDTLTNLPNRRLLLPRLEAAIERAKSGGGRGAVLFLDLDRFKVINDSLGHSAGDEMLVAVVQRLKATLRPGDLLARFGGDEFVIVLEGLGTREEAGRFADGLIEQLNTCLMKRGDGDISMGASIGISVFPDDADNASRLIQNADTALYSAKLAGRGCSRFYDVAQTLAANVRLQREARMRRAIERQEFILHYQPLYSLKTGRVQGVEALVRWKDPVLGLVPPTEFIPIAEDTGLITQLGDWVLREACAQMRAWRELGADIGTMAVNLSPRQFRQAGLVERLRHILAETGLEPRLLELEITESALADDGDSVRLKLAAMKLLGVRLAIDDFGTGYSSLSYLRRFPIDKLKVDRSFVRDIETDVTAAEIAAAIIGLGKSLGLEVLGEGVETEAQKSFLVAQGCHTAQGYLFSKALPADEVQHLILGEAVLAGSA